jgi:hypothetical protein
MRGKKAITTYPLRDFSAVLEAKGAAGLVFAYPL